MGSSTYPNRSSRRRSLIESASKTFAFLDRPKARKERLSDDATTSKIKISPPYDFRDMTNSSSSSSGISTGNTPPQIHSNSNSEQHNSHFCLSPQDKPLPSLPIVTVMSGSPAKTRRLLIDAEEKPLRRSISPSQEAFEDWPSLSPEKQRDITLSNKTQNTVKPSISDGLAERIKQLNLDDGIVQEQQIAYQNNTEASPLVTSPKAAKPTRSARTVAGSKLQAPQVRQNRASQLRLCMSQGNVGEPKVKKQNLSSPLAVTSGNANTRARSLKRSEATQQARIATRSRSRSRHRVTAGGSPYVLSQKTPASQDSDSSPTGSLVLDSNRIDTDFTNTSEQTFQAATDTIAEFSSEQKRRSSIPLPKRLRPPLYEVKNELKPNDKQHFDDKALGSLSETAIGSRTASELNHKFRGKSRELNSSRSDDEDSPLLDDNEQFQIRSVSRNAPDRGPTLRISPKADEFLRGIGSGFEATEQGTDTAKKSSLSNLKNMEQPNRSQSLSKATGTRVDENSGPDQLKRQFTNDDSLPPIQQSPSREQKTEDQAFTVSSKTNSHEQPSIADKRNIIHATTTSAPPIKAGVPIDNSRTNGWPFRESAIAPFKTATTPERNTGWGVNSKGDSNRSSNTSSQNEPSSGHSTRSRYAIGEALTRVTPVEKTIKPSPSLVNTTAETHKAATFGDAIGAFPPRSTSRSDRSTPLTGLRKTSTPVSDVLPTKTAAARAQTAPKATSTFQKHRVTSAAHGIGNLNGSAGASRYNINKQLPSPVPSANPMSTSKGVLKNIRTLFHKRSNLYASVHSPLHRVHHNEHDSVSSKKSMLARVTMTPSTSSQTPRSPQVKGTSSLAGRTSPVPTPTPRMFPVNRSVRPLASSSPVEPEVESTPSRGKPKLKNHTTQTPAISTPTPLEPAYLTTATSLVYTLLDIVQKDPGATQAKKEELVELSKVMVEVLTYARDVEMALESIKAEAVKCEMRAGEVRELVGRVEGIVRGLGLESGSGSGLK